MKASETISKKVLSIYEGQVVGTIENLLFCPTRKKCIFAKIYSEKSNEMFLLDFSKVYRIGKDILFIKNKSALELPENLELKMHSLFNPINSLAYDLDGNHIGKLCDINFNKKMYIENFEIETESDDIKKQTYKNMEANKLFNFNKQISLFNLSMQKISIRNFTYKKIPSIKNNYLVQIANGSLQKENLLSLSNEKTQENNLLSMLSSNTSIGEKEEENNNKIYENIENITKNIQNNNNFKNTPANAENTNDSILYDRNINNSDIHIYSQPKIEAHSKIKNIWDGSILPKRVITDYNFLLNRVITKNITAINGELIAKKNSKITPSLINKVRSFGRLVELTNCSK